MAESEPPRGRSLFPSLQIASTARKTTHFSEGPNEKDYAVEPATTDKKDLEKSTHTGKHRWTLGILADKQTDEVPGTVLLLSKFSTQNIPLGLQHEQGRGRSSSRGSISAESERRRSLSNVKKTPDGIILNPQPDDSQNDPLNWPAWRRDTALLSLGFYCMVGGGMTPILAAGFHQVASSFDVSYADVARSTGLYMLGLGIGSVIMSPTAILFGKRPVYLFSSVLFIGTSIWCAVSPDYTNLVIARVFQGISVSPVECLPSATIAEIFFLHERAFRVGIYTLLLLGGKNLIPLVSAAVIQSLGWRWVFYIVAIVVGFSGVLLFLFVPETFWDRTPRPKALRQRSSSRLRRRSTSRTHHSSRRDLVHQSVEGGENSVPASPVADRALVQSDTRDSRNSKSDLASFDGTNRQKLFRIQLPTIATPVHNLSSPNDSSCAQNDPTLPTLHNLNSPYYLELRKNNGYFDSSASKGDSNESQEMQSPTSKAAAELDKPTSPLSISQDPETPATLHHRPSLVTEDTMMTYTTGLQREAPKPWLKTLNPWNGRLGKTSWFKAALRPFILYAYPSVLWSALVYSLSVGWLIVLSESVSAIYANRESYNFDSLQIGLVYMSPFIGGILGTAVAGKFSDVVVRYMARRNDGIYEPEYRLVMAIPIAITTAIGLMGFGWSAAERDAWIVPSVFFGIISFGCSLGSTTAITFVVDSYREFSGEALVTLNFSKNIFHGLVWSLFFPKWLESDGPKKVFVTIGGIQVACLLLTIPMYIYGKRARMWTVRKGMMNRL